MLPFIYRGCGALDIIKFPCGEDPISNRIQSIAAHLLDDESGKYLHELLDLLIDYAALFPYGEDASLDRFEAALTEAKLWLSCFADKPKENEQEK